MSQPAMSYDGSERSPAPFFDDIIGGVSGGDVSAEGAAWWLTTEDNLRIRLGVWPQGSKGTVLIFPGRTEYIEKYGVTAAALGALGFAAIAVDWRGQGLADRTLPNRNIGHIDDFKDFQKDLRAVLHAARDLDLPKPFFVLGHSMGGSIALRALMEGLDAAAVAFSAPMWGISLTPFRRSAGWAISHIGRRIGLQGTLSPGTFETPYALLNPFENNMLTTDPEMYAMLRTQLKTHPDLSLGGPSIAWLNEALIECRALSLRPTPDIPAITLLGSNERIVDVAAIHDRMARWENGILQVIDQGEHEILMDTKARRSAAIRDIAAHFETHR